jgi:hypothetical protein
MAILRPITEAQVEISLYRDDGEMYYRAAFISSSPFGAKLEGLKVIYRNSIVKVERQPSSALPSSRLEYQNS